MEPKLDAPGARAGELGLLPRHPGARPHAGQDRHGQRLAAAAAAVRVLRGLRRLRRDALPEAHEPALRRPDADRQRHRLLVDLRRQPADDAVDDQRARAAARPGPTRCSRTTPSSAWASGWRSTSRREYAERPARAAGRRSSATSWSRRCSRQHAGDRGARSPSSASRVAELKQRLAGDRRARGARAPGAWPTAWSARASGSSAATAGPTTSASAAWTTSWPPAATSTSWCSTPRSTRTPAARPRRRRPAARWPSSPPAARRSARRTWA